MKNVNSNQNDVQVNVAPLSEMLNYQGFYGQYGGAYVPSVLEEKMKNLSDFFDEIVQTNDFQKEFITTLKDFIGRPSPLYLAKNLSKYIGSTIYLKREDLNHTGSHKINNAVGQILLAKKNGSQRNHRRNGCRTTRSGNGNGLCLSGTSV